MNINKKANTLLTERTIFIVLNLVFFMIMLFFVYTAGGRVFVLEQFHAKKIALVIDNIEPGMSVYLDVNEAVEAAKKNGLDENSIFTINKDNGSVRVYLQKQGGYSFEYFSNVDIELKLSGNTLSIKAS
jgi:hypothetical protein